MDELQAKIEELLKSLFALKEQQGFFVPAIKPPTLKSPSPKSAPTIPGGLPPPSKKDPKKVAEQLKNPRPQKPKVEVLKIEDNGQWNLNKADIPDTHIPLPKTGPMRAAPGVGVPKLPDTHIPKPGSPSTAASSPNAAVRQMARDTALKAPLSAATHGWKTHSPDQNNLIEGLTLHNAKPVNQGNQGAAFASSISHPHQAVVKNSADHMDREARGHLRNGFNSARREVLYHDLAHDFFGMGQHVPTTAGFTHRGNDWSAQKKIDDASHYKFKEASPGQFRLENPNHERILGKLANSGDMDKLTLMDHIMGHHDRHSNNFLLDDKGDNLHLIDNGTAFDYGNLDAHPVPHYRKDTQRMQLQGKDGHDMSQGLHPEARNWISKLNPEEARKVFAAHGHDPDSPAVKGFMGRLRNLQGLNSKFGDKIDPDDMLKQNRMLTHQDQEEYI